MAELVEILNPLINSFQQPAIVIHSDGVILSANSEYTIHLKPVILPAHFDLIIDRLKNCSSVNFQFCLELSQAGKFTATATKVDSSSSSIWVISFLLVEENSWKEQYERLEKMYGSFIENNFELIIHTSEDDQWLFFNVLAIQSFGVQQQNMDSIYGGVTLFEEIATYERLKQKIVSDGKMERETVFFKRVDGTRLTGLVNGYLANDIKGSPVLVWIILDISDRIEYEDRLQLKTDQLEKLNLQMEKFLYSTSHDLRSPITSILGLVNLLRMETRDKIVLDYIQKIEATAHKLDKTIKDIMIYSKNNYQRTTSERIDFEPLVWKVWNSYRKNPNLRKISLEVSIQGNAHIYSDPERMEIILDGLLSNCINFYDSNKSKPFVKIEITSNQHEAQLLVADNGIGIGKAYIENIFTMFFKATHLSKGAGLGLFIVREAITQLHGTVHVQSEIGFGSVFKVIVPNDPKGRLINRKMQLLHTASSVH